MALLVRIYRLIPLVIVVLLIAAAIYLVVQAKHNPQKAKLSVIKFFMYACLMLMVFFAIWALYAIFENNTPHTELSVSGVVLFGVILLIDLWVRHAFLKKNPKYKRPAKKARLTK